MLLSFAIVISASPANPQGSDSNSSKAMPWVDLLLLDDIDFEHTFGGTDHEYGRCVRQTTDGGYVVAGYTSSGNNDVYVLKTDENGIAIWNKTFGGTGYDYAQCFDFTENEGLIITGYTNSTGNYDVYLLRTDGNGNEVWNRTFGGTGSDVGYSIRTVSDGGFVVAGYTNSFGAGLADVYLLKTDADGNLAWSKTFGGTDYDYSQSVDLTGDGGFVIAGYTYSSGAGVADVYLLKTDADGNLAWSKTFGGTQYDYGQSVVQTSDGGFVIAGYTNSFGAGSYDVYLVKTYENGSMLWSRTFGGTSSDIGQSVQQTSDGGFIIAGYTSSYGTGGYDVYLLRTDGNGNELWHRTFGGVNSDYSMSVRQTTDGGFVITGYTNVSGNYDVYLIKTDENGNIE